LLLAEAVVLDLPALPQLLLERLLQVLYVDLKGEEAAAEGIGDVDDLEVVDAEQVWDGVDDARLHALDDPLQLPLLRARHALHQHLRLLRVLVLVQRDLPEDLVDLLLGQHEVFTKHLLELEFLALCLLALVTPHAISIIIKPNNHLPLPV
jgi:hypothetical protein